MNHGVQIQIGRSFPGHGLYWQDNLTGDPLAELVVVLSGMFVNYARSGHKWAFTFLADTEPPLTYRFGWFHRYALLFDHRRKASILTTHWASTNHETH